MIISETEYNELRGSYHFAEALMQGGVDNWDGLGESLEQYAKNHGYMS